MLVGLAGMEPQQQGGEIGDQQRTGTSQRLRVVGEQGQIIHVPPRSPDAGQGTEAVIEGIEVEIGQELAGEVADRQTAGTLQRGQQGVAGKGIDGRAKVDTVGEGDAQQQEGAGAADLLLQLLQQQPVFDGGCPPTMELSGQGG